MNGKRVFLHKDQSLLMRAISFGVDQAENDKNEMAVHFIGHQNKMIIVQMTKDQMKELCSFIYDSLPKDAHE